MDSSVPPDAAVLRCPACGAGCAPTHRACDHCGNHLAALRCPACGELHFSGARVCTRCGRQLRAAEALGATTGKRCPRCVGELATVTLGEVDAGECPRCGGVFIDVATLRRITADRAQAAAVPVPRAREAASVEEVRYVACPVCAKLMNRVNFGRRSGIIVDVCGHHGTWFDAGELARALSFVAEGGLIAAKELEQVERRVTPSTSTTLPFDSPSTSLEGSSLPDLLTDLVFSVFPWR